MLCFLDMKFRFAKFVSSSLENQGVERERFLRNSSQNTMFLNSQLGTFFVVTLLKGQPFHHPPRSGTDTTNRTKIGQVAEGIMASGG